MGRQQQENFQHRRWRGFEGVACGNVDEAIDFIKALVDHLNIGRLREQSRLDILQQDRVELGDRLGRPVITLHQHLAGAPPICPAAGGVKAQTLGDRRLHIEQQPIFAPAALDMQADPDVLEGTFLVGQLMRLGRGDQAPFRQFTPGIAQSRRLGDPQDDLQVAQTARTFLAIGLEAVRRVFVFHMALAHFQGFCLEKCLWLHRGVVAFFQQRKQALVAGDATRFQQAGLDRDVGRRFDQDWQISS